MSLLTALVGWYLVHPAYSCSFSCSSSQEEKFNDNFSRLSSWKQTIVVAGPRKFIKNFRSFEVSLTSLPTWPFASCDQFAHSTSRVRRNSLMCIAANGTKKMVCFYAWTPMIKLQCTTMVSTKLHVSKDWPPWRLSQQIFVWKQRHLEGASCNSSTNLRLQFEVKFLINSSEKKFSNNSWWANWVWSSLSQIWNL